MDYQYDLFVIGAGSGGVRAARIAASHGAKVGIAEASDLGGTCVNLGCVPKKLFVYASSYLKHHKDSFGYGWNNETPRFDWNMLIENKNKEIKRLNGIYKNLLDGSGVELHTGFATFKSSHEIDINGQIITTDKILIATGGRPSKLNIPGGDMAINSDDAFHLKTLPNDILIIGGGYIAVEFAGIFNGLGCNVTLVNRSPTLLRNFDEDIQKQLIEEYQKKDIKLILGNEPVKIEKSGDAYIVHFKDGEQTTTDLVMTAVGRDANTDKLNLQEIGITASKNGQISTNKDNQTNIDNIYALGDIANNYVLTPVAIKEGHMLADRLYGNKPDHYVDYEHIATAIFSQPPIGTVGLSEQDAHAKGFEVNIYKTSFRAMKHTLSGRDEKTFMKLVVDKKTDKLLGIHMMGDDAPEVIQLASTILKLGGTKADLNATMPVHPTSTEELVTMREPAN